ncbi:MAG: YcbK family protein [Azonexus sp.]|nr:YcbK family protein [Azonexus sp.]
MSNTHKHSRRLFLSRAARLAVAGAVLPLAKPALASLPNARSLDFDHTHTGERISVVFAVGNHYVPDALLTLNRFLRDHYSGEVGAIDPQLFDLLFKTRQELGTDQVFQVISGYRCAATNSHLRNSRGGGVARQSLHMHGKAIDIRIPGIPLSDLRDAAKSLNAGGVGFYPRDKFVHVDTGKVRYW